MADATAALAAGAGSDERVVRILTLGDSLTAGYAPPDDYNPYGVPLQALVQAAMPDGVRVVVTVLGYSGFTTAKILANAGAEGGTVRDVMGCTWHGLDAVLTTHPFDLVVVMSGTNDLAARFPDPDTGAAKIVGDLQALHSRCHDHGVPTLALPIPDSKAVTAFPSLGAVHGATNRLWRATTDLSTSEWRPKQRVTYADVAGAVPAVQADGMTTTEWMSFDGLHLSPAGYNRLAEAVAPHVLAALDATAPPAGK